jgi:small subunit ribosomal protein S15
MKEIIEKFQRDPKDTGSAEVQVILMTQRIQMISAHMQKHRKDVHCLRGLKQCISKRKSLLAYVSRKSVQRYQELIQALGLRR